MYMAGEIADCEMENCEIGRGYETTIKKEELYNSIVFILLD
jgi:hypothetical protein